LIGGTAAVGALGAIYYFSSSSRANNTEDLTPEQILTRDRANAANYKPSLTEATLSNEVKDAKYAVRGAIPARGAEIAKELAEGKQYPFKKMTPCNIGNPQSVGQGCFTFHREVLSCILSPQLVDSDSIS
jgi:hypothetical protein